MRKELIQFSVFCRTEKNDIQNTIDFSTATQEWFEYAPANLHNITGLSCCGKCPQIWTLIILILANMHSLVFFLAALTSVLGFSEVFIAHHTKYGMMGSVGPLEVMDSCFGCLGRYYRCLTIFEIWFWIFYFESLIEFNFFNF
jgi:hypothetical protein